MRDAEQAWLRRFASRGHPAATPLASGMEGAVYRLGDDLVAKVWEHKGRAELAALGDFYEQLAVAGLDFATPRFLELWAVDGVQVTIERMLPGKPLDSVCPPGTPPGPRAVDCMVEALGGLRCAGELAAARTLPVLGESAPMWDGVESWPAALLGLVERRLARGGDLLRARLPAFDALLERLRDLIAGLPSDGLCALHGDLIPANVLVDEDLRPLAVLDFGFLTTVGDPFFDLAVTASVFDMYGPHARRTEAAIDRAAAGRFGLAPERLALYRAAYAIATASVYAPGGEDGHFRWCVEMLRREDIVALLGVDAGRAGSGG
jgi:hypothetical protein